MSPDKPLGISYSENEEFLNKNSIFFRIKKLCYNLYLLVQKIISPGKTQYVIAGYKTKKGMLI